MTKFKPGQSGSSECTFFSEGERSQGVSKVWFCNLRDQNPSKTSLVLLLEEEWIRAKLPAPAAVTEKGGSGIPLNSLLL